MDLHYEEHEQTVEYTQHSAGQMLWGGRTNRLKYLHHLRDGRGSQIEPQAPMGAGTRILLPLTFQS